MSKKQFSVRLPDELRQRLEAIALEQRRSLNRVILDLLETSLPAESAH